MKVFRWNAVNISRRMTLCLAAFRLFLGLCFVSALGLSQIASAQTVQIGEVGSIAGNVGDWQTVTLSGSYTDPIVVAQARNYSGGEVGRARVQTVTGTSFQVAFKDFDFEAQGHAAQVISYFVVERGAWILPNGQKIEAGDVSATCCDVDSSTNFAQVFDTTPALIATPNTNRAQSVYFRAKDLTASSFNMRFTDADATGDPETINWIAMETGGDGTYGIAELLTTTENAIQTWTYGQTLASTAHVFYTTRSYLDATPMTNRLNAPPSTTSSTFFQQIGTNFVYHAAAEDISAAAMPEGTIMGTSPLVVTNTNDSGGGSLRDAIEFANANTAADDITFAIPSAGPHVISLSSELPTISDDGVSIDGTSQTGAICGDLWSGAGHTLQIQIDGGTTGVGLRANANNVTIKGLSITDFQDGIYGDTGRSDLTVQCNYLGLAPDGTANGANGSSARAILVVNPTNLTVGGPNGADGNVISASDSHGFLLYQAGTNLSIENNFIGTDPTGIAARANTFDGLLFYGSGTFTLDKLANNLISGNGRDGVITYENAVLQGVSGDALIQGNYIGVDRTGNTALANGNDGWDAYSGTTMSGITFGGTSTTDRNIISGNTSRGLNFNGTDTNVTFLGNYIGVGADGTTDLGNGSDGFLGLASTNLTFGNGAASGRNVISGNGTGIRFNNPNGVSMQDNYVGVGVDGSTPVGNSGRGIVLNASVGGSGVLNALLNGNVISGNGTGGIDITSSAANTLGGSSTITITNNKIGVAANGTTAIGNGEYGVKNTNVPGTIIVGGDGAGNIIANTSGSGGDGIVVGNEPGTQMAILANSIYGNTNLGIDLMGSGNSGENLVAANDTGDADTGGNELLNFPLINIITANGTTSIGYSVELDVPANTQGYRIEFFKNSSPDATNGEGEIFLGFVGTGDHAGGAISYDGTFTANEAVSVGDSISATTTRKTGATSYDITSEFAVNKAAQSSLVVTNTNDSGAGSLRAAIDYANANPTEDDITFNIPGSTSDVHTIMLVSALPTITDAGIVLDGTTQGNAVCGDLWAGEGHTLRIDVEWPTQPADTSDDMILVTGDDVTIKGLALTDTGTRAVNMSGLRTTLQCSYVGVDPDGTYAAIGNGRPVFVPGDDPLIGGSAVGEGNVIVNENAIISNNGVTNMIVRGNFIGVDPTGTSAMGNCRRGVSHVSGSNSWGDITGNLISNCTIGGVVFDAGKTFSGVGGADIAIKGNYLGTDRTGTASIPNGDGVQMYAGDGISVGGTALADRNVISGNTGEGIDIQNANNVTILGNYIGLGADGSTDVGNDGMGIQMGGTGVNNIQIGDGSVGGRNVISGNESRAIEGKGTLSNIDILGNYIGTDATGNVRMQSGQTNNVTGDGVSFDGGGNTTGLDIIGNVIGGYDGANLEFWNSTVQDLIIQGNKIGVGANGSSDISSSAAIESTVQFGGGGTFTNVKIGGTGANEGNFIANGPSNGIRYESFGSNATIIGNTITNKAGSGIYILGASTEVSLLQNNVYNNGSLGIDVFPIGVNDNDSGDSDAGPNALLNYPLINTITADGTTSVGYSVELDVPANTEGYRIEFFKNSSPDTTNGEGEIFLGFVDTGDHAGGAISFDGTFTASEAVSVGDSISATTTRKTATGYDITSEFAVNKSAQSSLVVTNTNDSGAGSLRAAIDYANSVTTADNITFQIPNTGPHTISLMSALPTITDADVIIDGTSQSGTLCGDLWSGVPPTLMIRLNDGASINSGLATTAANTTFKGLSVTGFGYGLLANNGSDGAILQCNYAGLTPNGTAGGNGRGVWIDGTNVKLGGLAAGEGNVVSSNTYGIQLNGNATNVTIQGNFVGTDPTGMSARANTNRGFANHIGTATINEIRRNLISGNTGVGGIAFNSDDTWTGVGGADFAIAGNYIGTDRTGNTALPNTGDGINFTAGTVTDLVIGGTDPADRNIISGNGSEGIELGNQSDVSVLGNYIGLGANGTTPLGNGGYALYYNNVSDAVIGDGTTGGRNIFTNSGLKTLQLAGTFSNASINGNYFGTDSTGNVALSNGTTVAANVDDAVLIANGTNVDIVNNVIGGFRGELIEFWGAYTGNDVSIQGNSLNVGVDGVTNIASSASINGAILFGNGYNANGVKIGGTGANEGNIIAHFTGSGIGINSTSGLVTGEVISNEIRDNGGDGIQIDKADAQLAIYANSIYDNGGLGIDLNANGVTDNDVGGGDADTGANDLLNFPVINDFASDGNTAMSYDINLDVPSGDYRIDFYRNSSVDSSGYGEGEFHLGFVEITHSGGNQQHTGSFTANSAVVQGNYIAATTTRKTGMSVYDITSEFSLTTTTGSPTELTASKTVAVYDPTSAGLYSLPGNDVISSLTVTNPGSSPADADSIVIIEAIPAEVTFYNGPIDDAGGSNPVSFVQTGGANLTFTYMTDVKYSDSGTRPTDMTGCTYTPSGGYDAAVTYVCINPKGSMGAGDPDPTFTIAYRARIQ